MDCLENRGVSAVVRADQEVHPGKVSKLVGPEAPVVLQPESANHPWWLPCPVRRSRRFPILHVLSKVGPQPAAGQWERGPLPPSADRRRGHPVAAASSSSGRARDPARCYRPLRAAPTAGERDRAPRLAVHPSRPCRRGDGPSTQSGRSGACAPPGPQRPMRPAGAHLFEPWRRLKDARGGVPARPRRMEGSGRPFRPERFQACEPSISWSVAPPSRRSGAFVREAQTDRSNEVFAEDPSPRCAALPLAC